MSRSTDLGAYRNWKWTIFWAILGLLLLFLLCGALTRILQRSGVNGEGGLVNSVGEVADGAIDTAQQAIAGQGGETTTEVDAVQEPPLITSAEPDSNGTQLLIKGVRGAPGYQIKVMLNDNFVGNAVPDSQGNWQIAVANPGAGSYKVVASIINDAGDPEATYQNTLVIQDPQQTSASTETEAPVEEQPATEEEAPAEEQSPAEEAPAEEQPDPEEQTEEQTPAPAEEEAPAETSAINPAAVHIDPPADWRNITYSLPPYIAQNRWIGGGLRVEGLAQPNQLVDIVVNGVYKQTVQVDSVGNYAYWMRIPPEDAGNYNIVMRYNRDLQSTTPNFTVTVPQNTVFAPNAQSCVGNYAPFGEDRGDSYVVNICESFSLVADRAGISFGSLQAANPTVNVNRLNPGDVLRLPPRP